MFYKLDDFFRSYETLTEGTVKIFSVLTDQNIAHDTGGGNRTPGQIAWHITTTVAEMMSRTGLQFNSIDPKSPPPSTAGEIVAGYRAVAKELVDTIQASWNDETMMQTDEMYGETWPRGLTAAILIHHEIHHRGQLTVLLRLAGVVIPGVYGPAKEEWKAFGMDEPAY